MSGPSELILIGAGGHAKVLIDAIAARNIPIGGYVDPRTSGWLEDMDIPAISEDALTQLLPSHPQLVMGFVGLSCESLKKRYSMLTRYHDAGAIFAPLVHPSAIISNTAELAAGVQVLPGAIINSHAKIGEGAIINSGAVIEHDVHIGAGSHIAPRAVVLGEARVSELCYVGSGAVVIQGAQVPPASFIKALSLFK